MLQLLNHIVILLSSFTCNYINFDFMNYNFKKKQSQNYFYYFLILIVCNYLVNLHANTYLNFLWSFITLIFLSKYLYKSETRSTFFPFLLLITFNILIETIVCYSLEYFFIIKNIPFDYFYYIAVFSSNIIILLLYKPIRYLLSKKSIQPKNQINIIDSVILFISFLVVILFSFFLKLNLPTYLYLILILISVFVVLLDIYLVFILDDKIQYKQLQQELKLIKMQQQLNEQYYHQKNEQYNKQMKLFHDFKNHLAVIENMYKNGDIEEATNYSKQLINTMNISSVSVNNKALRILMDDFIEQCKTKNVPLHYELDSRISFSNIQEMDIVTIYSNLMNNALEASICCEHPNIHIKIFIHNSMVITEFSNAYSGEIKEKNESFISTKDNHFGYGLTNIKEITDKYDGTLDIYYENQLFKVMLILPFEV